jgi:hypothetical protein
MVSLIKKVLADQGYYHATRLQTPTILLAFSWGSMSNKTSMSLLFMGGDKLDLTWELNPYVGNLLTPRVFTRHMRSAAQDAVMGLSGSDLYVASVQAYDETAAMNGDAVLLWHTKMTCPANVDHMGVSLRQAVRASGPFFGRETALPVVATAPVPTGNVEIGELKVLESIDTTRLPITDRTDESGRLPGAPR